jgi:hypothetical protein
MTKTAKAKGRLGQQEIRDRLLEEFPEFEPDDIKSTTMGDTGADIQLSPSAKRRLNLAAEVKRRQGGGKSFYDWMAQAKRHAKNGEDAAVFFRADRKPWMVVIDLDYYMKLLRGRDD